MENKNNCQLVCEQKEKDGHNYTNFYLILGNGLLKVAIDLKTFGDKSVWGRVKRYCEQTK